MYDVGVEGEHVAVNSGRNAVREHEDVAVSDGGLK
jgi:hypothetical protein